MSNHEFIEDVENVECYDVVSYFDKNDQKYYLKLWYKVETKSKTIFLMFPKVELPIKINCKTFPSFYENEYASVRDTRVIKANCPVYLDTRDLSVSRHYINLWGSNDGTFEVFPSEKGKKDFYIVEAVKEKVISMTKEEIEQKLGYKINIIDDSDNKNT